MLEASSVCGDVGDVRGKNRRRKGTFLRRAGSFLLHVSATRCLACRRRGTQLCAAACGGAPKVSFVVTRLPNTRPSTSFGARLVTSPVSPKSSPGLGGAS